jgi:hypothetical protein
MLLVLKLYLMFGFVRVSMANDQDKSTTLQSLVKENRIKKPWTQMKKLEFITELQDLLKTAD